MAQNDWATVQDFEPRLDALTQPKNPPPNVSAALFYAEMGLHVFPLQPHLKIPYKGTRGCKDATAHRETIIGWWTQWPDSNIGIATGHLVDVIDIDGAVGVQSWARTTDMPDTIGAVSTTRPGGIHLYLKASGLKNGAKLLPGIDVRGEGGYVVAPPSHLKETRKPNRQIEQYEGTYRWRHPLNFDRVIPPLQGPIHDDNLCAQCGHQLDAQPHPKHYLKG